MVHLVLVELHHIPDIHPNIQVVPAVGYVVDTDVSYEQLGAHTVTVVMVEVDNQLMLVVDIHIQDNRVVDPVEVVLVEAVLSDGTSADSSEAEPVDIALVVVLLMRVLAGTLVVKVHWILVDSVVEERHRTYPFDSENTIKRDYLDLFEWSIWTFLHFQEFGFFRFCHLF